MRKNAKSKNDETRSKLKISSSFLNCLLAFFLQNIMYFLLLFVYTM